jgi:N-acetylneuraminic acid mutarotase
MKRIYFNLFSAIFLCTLFSCSRSSIPYTQQGDWAAESQLNGPARSEAVSFVIDNFAYVGTGWDGLNTRYTDFWKYDPVGNVWSQVTSMPGVGRSSAIAFSAGGKGYVGTGYDGFNYLNDFYELDLSSNTWTQKANFAGSARYEAAAFGIGNFGYVGTGFDGSNALKDFFQYDPSKDVWTDVGFSGNKRFGAVTWVYNNEGYLVTGVNSGSMQSDFWKFNPASDTAKWTELRHITNFSSDSYDDGYTNIVRWNAVAFVIGTSAYISTGENGVNYTFTWQYDLTPGVDQWSPKTPFEGPATTGAVGFSLNAATGGGGFLCTGRSSPGQAGSSDFLWEFFPNNSVNPNDN